MTAYTVGHSNHPIEHFLKILLENNIMAIADVRSVPYSRFTPQFDRETLQAKLKSAGIVYSFLGKELGARPSDKKCYDGGTAVYDLISETALFQSGLDRVVEGCKKYKLALMCAEKEPLDCHRTVLVGRNLKKRDVLLRHILADGSIEESADADNRLVKITKQEMDDLFSQSSTATDPVERAYDVRGKEIAFTESQEPVPQQENKIASGQ